MRVAFVGKGGAGKSTVSGTFARLLARTSTKVLALDSDPMPGMAYALGASQSDAGLPDDAVEAYEEGGATRYRLSGGLSGRAAIERWATRGPDGVLFLQLGKAHGPRWDNTRQHFGFQRVCDDLPGEGWHIVGDLPGGTRQPFMSWGRYAETFLVVVEATQSSLLTARRLAGLAQMPGSPRVLAVANKVCDTGDVTRVRLETGLEVVAAIPLDPALASAARTGGSLLDLDPDAPAVAGIRSLVGSLISEGASS